MRFANDFHSWLRHSWKSLANRLTRDPKFVIHGNSCIILYIFMGIILCSTPNHYLNMMLYCQVDPQQQSSVPLLQLGCETLSALLALSEGTVMRDAVQALEKTVEWLVRWDAWYQRSCGVILKIHSAYILVSQHILSTFATSSPKKTYLVWRCSVNQRDDKVGGRTLHYPRAITESPFKINPRGMEPEYRNVTGPDYVKDVNR